MSARARLVIVAVLLLGAGLLVLDSAHASAGAKPKASKSKSRAAGESGTPADSFLGLSVPLNATDLLAPESGFSIAGWRSWGGDLKIVELTKDGTQVKTGDVLARFEFNGADALRHVEGRVQRAQADRSQARIRAEQKVEGLQVDQRSRKLEAELAAIDLRKERAISQRQIALFRITHKLAEFEQDAIAQRLSSALRTRDAEFAFHDKTVARNEQDLERYAFYERRYKILAPHDGVLRHAYNPRDRRKFQKGDNVRAGTKLIAVARDEKLGVRFFVPEHRLKELTVGTRLTVVSPASGEELRAAVKRIDFFPQELGFLMELPNLPNAREKAFAVLAEFDDSPQGLTAGTELRVKVVGR